MVVCEPDADGELVARPITIVVARAECAVCGSKPRLLPSDVLPRKRYSLPLIEHAAAEYARGGKGLRKVVGWIHGDGPTHATLHAWTEGIGAYGLGRDVHVLLGDPFSAVLAETLKRRPDLKSVIDADPPAVDERRYRSRERKERLAAMARLLMIARALAASSLFPFSDWRAQSLLLGLSSPIAFRTGFRKPPIEHGDSESGQDRPRRPKPGGPRCRRPRPRSRSPPGDTI